VGRNQISRTVLLDATRTRAGIALTRADAVLDAERAIDTALETDGRALVRVSSSGFKHYIRCPQHRWDVCYQIFDRARSSIRCRAVMSLLAGLGRCRVALPRFTFRNFKSSASKKVCLTRMRAGASRIT
jgi:hypothetical protein